MSQAFGVEPADLCVSWRRGNEARSAAICLARRVTEEAMGVLGESFGGLRRAAISKMAARVESRRGEDRAWDRRLAKFSERLQTSEQAPQKFNVKT